MELSDTYKAFIGILVIFGILGVFGNSLIIAVYTKRRRHNTKSGLGATNLFIVALAIIDLVVCACMIPYSIVYELDIVKQDPVCKIFEFIRHATILGSLFTLLGVAVER